MNLGGAPVYVPDIKSMPLDTPLKIEKAAEELKTVTQSKISNI